MKKILSVLISIVLLISSLDASLKDILGSDVMVNITKPKQWTIHDSRGRVISKNVYSGGVYFRFDNSYPPPMFLVSPPSIETGCNGFNLKGMFIQLLGIGQLTAQLKSAGVSVAWGVVVGLVYSLPGVASAFKMINQWAKDLQKLLGNACQSGINIGRYIADKGLGMDKMRKKINKALKDYMPQCSQEGENCIVAALGLEDYFDKDGVFRISGVSEMSPQQKKDAVMRIFRGVFENDMSLGGKVIYNIIKKEHKNGSDSIASAIMHGSPKAISNDSSFLSYTFAITSTTTNATSSSSIAKIPLDSWTHPFSGSERTKMRIKLFGYVLFYNFIGDLILANSKQAMKSALSKYLTNEGQYGQQAANELMHIDNFTPQIIYGGPGASSPASDQALADFIYFGSRGKNLLSPIFNTIQMKNDESSESTILPILADPNTADKVIFDTSSYLGTRRGSECTVYRLVLGANSPYAQTACQTGSSSTTSSNIDPMPILFDNIDWFVKVIKNSPNAIKFQLIDALIEYNTYLGGLALISGMEETLNEENGFSRKPINLNTSSTSYSSNTQGDTPAYMKDAAKNQMKLMAKAMRVITEAKKSLEKKAGDLTTYKQIKALFEKQERKNQERGVKAIQ